MLIDSDAATGKADGIDSTAGPDAGSVSSASSTAVGPAGPWCRGGRVVDSSTKRSGAGCAWGGGANSLAIVKP